MVTVELWTCQSTLGDVCLMREIEVSNHKHIIIKLLNKEKKDQCEIPTKIICKFVRLEIIINRRLATYIYIFLLFCF